MAKKGSKKKKSKRATSCSKGLVLTGERAGQCRKNGREYSSPSPKGVALAARLRYPG